MERRIIDITPTREEMLAELERQLIEPEIPENAVTVTMLMERTGRIEKTCRALLEKYVRQGKMSAVMVKHKKYYYPI